MAAAKKRKGPFVLATMHVPPMLVPCHGCSVKCLAYAVEDQQTPPRYLCRKCFDSQTLGG